MFFLAFMSKTTMMDFNGIISLWRKTAINNW